jgi:hypothetical protein
MDSLESVTFSDCAGVTDDGIAYLARLPRLQTLRVSGQQITEDVTRMFPANVKVHYSP